MHALTLSAVATPPAPRWDETHIPDQSGRSVLVTGANSGLGFLTSLRLAQRGAHVIMTARDPDRGREALGRIEAAGVPGRVELRQLDLSDLTQVAAFADRLVAEGRSLDVLVNNAGIMMPPRTLTAQGHELQFGVNHLAHFALTARLLPLLRRGEDSRVVTLTSDLHHKGRIDFDDLTGQRRYARIGFYAQSKLANASFALELDRRLRASELPIRSVLAHPGYAATNLQLSGPAGLLKVFMRIGNRFLAQPAEIGVLPQLYAATMPDVRGGEFFGPDGPDEKKGYPTRVRAADAGYDEELALRLWQRSVELTGVDFDLRRPARGAVS
jgi:NAD(P)-dependent dehydrogenase (short-subunit alcohol dehydrogenase family)